MNIQFTDAQLALLKEVLSEYAEYCYQSMFDFQHTAVDAQEDFLKKEYSALALKVVKWKKILYDDFGDEEFPETKYYEKTSVYFFPYSTKDLSELWKIESGES